MDECVYNLSYNDIMKLPLPERERILKVFEKELENIPENIYKDSRTLNDMIMEASILPEEDISEYVFSGEKVIYYPNIKFVRVNSPFTCSVSGMKCSKGEESVLYKPFLYLPDKKSSYVLAKVIRAYYYYEDFFPRDLKSFDDFLFKVEHAYELGLEEYSNFSCNIHDNLTLRKLR